MPRRDEEERGSSRNRDRDSDREDRRARRNKDSDRDSGKEDRSSRRNKGSDREDRDRRSDRDRKERRSDRDRHNDRDNEDRRRDRRNDDLESGRAQEVEEHEEHSFWKPFFVSAGLVATMVLVVCLCIFLPPKEKATKEEIAHSHKVDENVVPHTTVDGGASGRGAHTGESDAVVAHWPEFCTPSKFATYFEDAANSHGELGHSHFVKWASKDTTLALSEDDAESKWSASSTKHGKMSIKVFEKILVDSCHNELETEDDDDFEVDLEAADDVLDYHEDTAKHTHHFVETEDTDDVDDTDDTDDVAEKKAPAPAPAPPKMNGRLPLGSRKRD
eukprot:GFYU01009860.1.p1 GENE.GFYU01009860.1~~GFYU01009860.1.p1  ORF type:complete len:331 (+),score=121.64 GFYU01009860.1:108-1100(+)